MSRRRRMGVWRRRRARALSLRALVPLALVVVTGLMALYDLSRSQREVGQRVEEQAREELSHRVAELQNHLEYLLREGQDERVLEEVARLGADPSVVSALLLDDQNRVAGSLRRSDVGRHAHEVRPSLTLPVEAERLARARGDLATSFRQWPGGLTAYVPVVWGGQVTSSFLPDRVGVLVVDRDLRWLLAQARTEVRQRVAERSAVLLVLALLLGLGLHFGVTRRLDRLVLAARRVAARDWSARSGLGGRDELAVVGRAFDAMVERLARSQARLARSEGRIRLLLDSTAEGIVELDPEGRIRFCNPAALRLLGYTDAAALRGRSAHALCVEDHVEADCPLLGALAKGEPVHGGVGRFARADGRPLWVEVWLHPARRDGKLEGHVLTFVDATERQRTEDTRRFLADVSSPLGELADLEGALAHLARLAVPRLGDWCVIDVVDDEGGVRRVAQAHADPARQPDLEALGRHYPPGWDSPQPTAHVLGSARPLRVPPGEDALLGTYAHDEENARLLRALGDRTALALPLTARGQVLGALLLAAGREGFDYGEAEVTLAEELARRCAVALDNARLYRQARAAIRLREEFLSVASHELHTPLTPLKLQLQTLKRTMEQAAGNAGNLDPGQLTPKLEMTLRQVGRLTRLVDDLLDVSRIVAGRLRLNPEPTDLAELAREVVERFEPQARAAGSTLRLTAPAGVAVGAWDRLRLEQVLVNLVSNALKYGPGQPVDVEVARAEDGLSEVRVRDRGIGIAPEHLERIFGRFERAVSDQHYGGLGLGLFISQQIVQAHGGLLEVSSRPGEGALFRARLPPRPPALEEPERHAPDPRA